MTGTSINPLLRAAYLSKAGYDITLLVPWLEEEQQSILFPGDLTFNRSALQEQYIRWWLETRGNVEAPNLRATCAKSRTLLETRARVTCRCSRLLPRSLLPPAPCSLLFPTPTRAL